MDIKNNEELIEALVKAAGAAFGSMSILWTKKVESAGHEKKGRRHCESTASTLGHFVSKVHSNA